MIRVLPMHLRPSVLKLLNYQITRLLNLFDLLCFRFGCRRILGTKARRTTINPAGAEAAAVHSCAACTAAKGDALSARFQLPGGNGSRQQNGRYDCCKQRSLADLYDHGFELLSVESHISAGRSGWSAHKSASRSATAG